MTNPSCNVHCWFFISRLTRVIFSGFKEVAFVHALVAAAVAKTVSADCARGVMTSCDKAGSKQRRSKKRYVSHNEAITHGIYFSEKFLNSGKSIHDVQGSVNRHNLRAGRLVWTFFLLKFLLQLRLSYFEFGATKF